MKRVVLVLALCALGAPAWAFDCAKATSRSEKAICGDARALAADSAMSAAFSNSIKGADGKTKAQMLGSQIAWIKERDNICAQNQGDAFAACLALESDRRRAFLSGTPEQGPGAPTRIAPRFRFEKGGPGKAAIDMELLRFPDAKSPGELAFNAATAKYLEDIVEPEKDDPAADRYAFENHMRLVYASPKLVSAQASAFLDSGGAHPNSYVANINLDVAGGRLLTFADAFDAKAAAKVFAICGEQVKGEKKERMGADAPLSPDDLKDLAKSIAESTGDLSAWSFGATQAEVTYSPYAVGAYVEGAYSCDIGYDALRPLLKPGFPLP